MFDYSIVIKPQMDAGTLRAIAQTGASRMAQHPTVPVFSDIGYLDVQFFAWSVYVGPAGMPQPVVEKLSRAFKAVLTDPAIVKYYADQGATLISDMDRDELRSFVLNEQRKANEIIGRAGIVPE